MRNFWLLLSVLWLWTCSGGGDKATGPEEPPIVINLTSLGGQAQKGPFNNGTAINVAELTNTLSPTGRNFSSAITDNTGRFAVANVQLESPYVELRANGFYFNEVSNEISDAQLTLFAISNLTGKTSLNVNILTHLEKNRMVTLMSGDNPKTFAQAKLQAQEEVLAIFDYSRANVPESELLDISQDGAANAKLLAISAIVQGDLAVGQMSQLLANMSTDIASDGTLDDTNLRNTLIENSKNLDMAEVRSNLVAHYTSLGISATIPDFETEINQFLKPPVAQDMSASTAEDTPINITLAASDPEGESLTYTILEVNNATVTLNGNVATYTPDAHFNGTDTFTFYANDGTSDSNIATVTMTVSAEDDEPNTLDVATTTDEDVAVVLQLTAEEYDGDSYSFAIITDVTNGTTSLNGSTVTYTPNQDFNGVDTFTFEATDDTGRTINVATATITVNPLNDAPVANDITNQVTDENRMMQLDITLDATDVDGDALTYNVASTNNGSVTINDNIATYVPNQDWNGEDTFTYTANDGSLDSNTATVTITVNSVNDAPYSGTGGYTMDEDSNTGIGIVVYDIDSCANLTCTANDENITFSITESPRYGVLNVKDPHSDEVGRFEYVPNANWHGEDSFSWKANDGELDSEVYTYTITVNPVDDKPIVYNVSAGPYDEDLPIIPDYINVRMVDPDGRMENLTPKFENINLPEGWSGMFSWFNFGIYRTTSMSEDNSHVNLYLQDPNDNYNLVLGFTYDNNSWNHKALSTDSQWDQFDPYDSLEGIIQQVQDYLGIYPWIDTYDEFIEHFNNDSGWYVNYFCDFNVFLTYPEDINGTQNIGYFARMYQGDDSEVAYITFDITPIDDAPTTNPVSVKTKQNTSVEITMDASDIDSDPSTFYYEVVTSPSNGTISNDTSTSTLTYTPNLNFAGEDSFYYIVRTGGNTGVGSNRSKITVNVNHPPDVSLGNYYFKKNQSKEINLGNSISDQDGDTLTFEITQEPQNGTIEVDQDAMILTYTPNTNFVSQDSFKVQAFDGLDYSEVRNGNLFFFPQEYDEKEYSKGVFKASTLSSVKRTSDNGFILIGSSTDAREFNVGISTDIFVSKLDNVGNESWNKSLTFDNPVFGNDITEMQNGNYAIFATTYVEHPSRISHRPLLIVIDSSGNVLWEQVLDRDRGGGHHNGQYKTYTYNVHTLSNGNILFGSTSDSYLEYDLSDLSSPQLIREVDISMNESNGWIGSPSVASSNDDITFLTNQNLIQFDSSGNEVWESSLNLTSPENLIHTTDGGFLAVGLNTSRSSDPFVRKINSIGSVEWEEYYQHLFAEIYEGSTSSDRPMSATETSNGDFVIAGIDDGETIYAIKIDSIGSFIWQKTYFTNGSNISSKFGNIKSVFELNPNEYILFGDNYPKGDSSQKIFSIILKD